MNKVLRTSLLAGLFVACGLAHAQAWPVKPVRIILSNSAGSSPDIIARVIADRLGKAFRQSFVIENRPGGEQVIGADLAAKSAADGYTFYFATNDTHVANLFRLKFLPYNPDRDFTPVANIVGSAAFIVAVHPELPVKSFPDLVALARARPGKISIGTTVGLSDVLAQWMNKMAGIGMLRVPYKLNQQAAQDAVGGQIQAVIISYISIQSFVSAGKLRLIAVTGTNRYPLMPDLPALTESYPGLIIEGWFFLAAPSGAPAEVLQRVNREVDRIVAEPEVEQRIRSFHFNPGPAMTPQAIDERLRAERARWKKLAEDIGLKPQ